MGDEKGQAEPGDIQTGRVIPGSIPQAGRINTTEPGSPLDGLGAVGGGR